MKLIKSFCGVQVGGGMAAAVFDLLKLALLRP
jgi:hypothetical protein